MKKLALILALMLVPCTAFGLEMLTDNALDTVTGQAGVSIAADDIQLFLNVERIAWIDCDGYGTSSAYGGDCDSTIGGALYLENFQMDTININMIGGRGSAAAAATGDLASLGGRQTTSANALGGSTCGTIDLFYDYGNTNAGGCLLTGTLALGRPNTLGMDNYTRPDVFGASSPNNFLAKSITIDATANLPLHTAGWRGNSFSAYAASETIGGVLIGLPTMEIYIHSMAMTPRFTAAISSNTQATIDATFNDKESYGTIEMQGITFTTLGGFMEIAPTGRPGDGF
jgi:hypothetical protein